MQPTTLLLMMIYLFGGTHAKLDSKDLLIQSINLDAGNSNPVKVCFTADPDNVPENTLFTLYVGTIGTEISEGTEYNIAEILPALPPADDTVEICVSSSKDFVNSPTTKLFFALQGETDTFVVKGIEYIQLPVIPPSVKAQWVGKSTLKASHRSTLRINENLDGWKISGDGIIDPIDLKCKIATEGPCYAVNIGIDTPEPLTVCALTDNDIPVHVKSISSIDAANTDGPTATTITLDYTGTTITTDITRANPELTNEALVYNGNDVCICEDATTCALTDYTPGDNLLNLILIAVSDGSATGSSELTFQDSKLQVYPLEETVLEARWTYYEDKYTAVREDVGGNGDDDGSFHTVDVDCTNNNGFCYAYYVNVNKNHTYTVTTKPNKAPDTDNLNQIKSVEVPMTVSRNVENSLRNISIEKHYKKDSGHLDLNICFSRDSTNGLINAQLEVILISANRQWKKVLEETMHKVEQEPCYSSTFLLKSDKDSHSLLTVLVIQRDVSSDQVISFHRSDINLSDSSLNGNGGNNESSQTMRTVVIIGTSVLGVASLLGLVIMVLIFVNRRHVNDGLQYPLQRNTFENSDIILGLDNLNTTL